jgi:hypothetical protein
VTIGILAAARDYRRRGWTVLPIPAGEKGPRCPRWQNLDLALDQLPQAFSADGNIGIILGRRSGYLVDGDLDCREALDLADIYLPATRAEFGRLSKARSHRLYVAQGAVYEAFADPTDSSVLLELRADGRDGGCHQTVFPPSCHPSGELVEWHGDIIAPLVVKPQILRMRMAYLAIACLVARHISHHAAERPSPDLSRLLWESDHDLGRVAYRWLGQPDPDATRSCAANYPAEISISPKSSARYRMIANGTAGAASEWRSSTHPVGPRRGLSFLMVGRAGRRSTSHMPSKSAGVTIAAPHRPGSAWVCSSA